MCSNSLASLHITSDGLTALLVQRCMYKAFRSVGQLTYLTKSLLAQAVCARLYPGIQEVSCTLIFWMCSCACTFAISHYAF